VHIENWLNKNKLIYLVRRVNLVVFTRNS